MRVPTPRTAQLAGLQNRIANIHNTGLLLPALGRVIGELDQCLGRGDANAHRDTGLLV